MTDTTALRSDSRSPAGFKHPGYRGLFEPGEVTLGLIMPLETYPNAPAPTLQDHFTRAREADEAGLSALWMRDIPFFDPRYGDAGQVFEPLTYIAALARETRRIALGTAGIVLPLREPKLLAKQVASLDHFTDGRMLLGLSSGDRPTEYPLFDIDFDSRGERFRDAFEVYRAVIEEDYPTFDSARFGRSQGTLDMLPKPPHEHTPTVAIGRAQQSTEWIAEHLDGHIAPSPPLSRLTRFAEQWRDVAMPQSDSPFKPLGIAGFLDLVADRDHPLQQIPAGFRTGSKALAEFMATAREAGIQHMALNPKISQRPHRALLDDLVRDVLPHFPTRIDQPI
ncbi:luciferase-type oxidoreductase, BA3436 family [Kushneria avicenniae]|uniref:Luciferase-type oxidoreductase, BA3436 family n=1 Tax=Kushneria avicenniae TaxID=402385 RepID=A0A1I1G6T1_9GAMM|nr:TIGR03571 family LLM class oxidoreductase [Kushneria avicenniae]SFC07245.1 luciferase-type oxidoreductase, BA3436 family [Kushneria avicenniae]